MQGLGRLEPAQGIAAMQAINVTAITLAFMLALLGTAMACAALLVAAVVERHEPFAVYLLAGGALYLVGPIGLTRTYHQPRNPDLATVQPTGADAPGRWTRYFADWTRLNHVRTATALAAAGLLTGALAAG